MKNLTPPGLRRNRLESIAQNKTKEGACEKQIVLGL
jgi:hypothetical protein